MKNFNKKTLVFLSFLGMSLSFTSCSSDNENTNLKFKNTNFNVVIEATYNLYDIIETDLVYDDLNFTFSDSSKAEIRGGKYLYVLDTGDFKLTIGYEDIELSADFHSTLGDDPHISLEETSYELDLSEEREIELDYSVYPSKLKVDIVTDADEKTYSVNGNILTINEPGNYSFSLSGKYDDTNSNIVNISVYAYDSIELSGNGTVDNPYLINNSHDLAALSEAVLNYKNFSGKYFLQTGDISLEEYENWTPIGTLGIPFEGIYDGGGFEVTDLFIETTDTYIGLFGFSTGVIKNLTVRGDVTCLTDQTGYVYSHSFAAGICGCINNGALIDNCVNYCNVRGDAYVAGVCGSIYFNDDQKMGYVVSKITNCKNYGNITGDNHTALEENVMYFGGVCGLAYGILKDCENHGDIYVERLATTESLELGNPCYVGGVAGMTYSIYKYGMDVSQDLTKYASSNLVNYGNVETYGYNGGVCGNCSLPLLNCKNYGNVRGLNVVGGIVGTNGTVSVHDNRSSYCYIKGCENYGDVYANWRNAGGICGWSYFDILDCKNDGTISTENYSCGGIVGYSNYGLISGCSNSGTVIGSGGGSYGTGGIVGTTETDIQNCTNTGEVKGKTDKSYKLGGIVGHIIYGTTSFCENTGKITGFYDVAGIVGATSIYNAVITDCINRGLVRPSNEIPVEENIWFGGICGMLGSNATIDKSINYGEIIGGGIQPSSGNWGGVGGIAGSFYQNSKVLNSENNGNVTGIKNVGGIVGYCQSSKAQYGLIDNCVCKSGLIKATGTGDVSLGCIAGRINYTKISNCTNYSNYEVGSGALEVDYIYGHTAIYNASDFENNTNYGGM